MKLELRVRHLTLDPAMRESCDRHLLHSLGRLEERIRRVQLWIEDLNGPRGGRDVRCCLRICLRRGGALTVEAVDAVPQAAVGEVFDRARTALLRIVHRQRWAPMRRSFRLVLS